MWTGLPERVWKVSGRHEFLGVAGHDHVDLGTGLDQQAQQFDRLVGGNAAGHAEQNLLVSIHRVLLAAQSAIPATNGLLRISRAMVVSGPCPG